MLGFRAAGTGERDYVAKDMVAHEDEFSKLYNEVMDELARLYALKDQSQFDVELHKLRKKMRKLIEDYFDKGVIEASSFSDSKERAESCKQKLAEIRERLTI